MKKTLKNIIKNLKDFHLRSTKVKEDEQIIEYIDDEYDLVYNLHINLYNIYFNSIEDKNNIVYLESISDKYLLNKDGSKFFISELLDLVSEEDDKWILEGENDYIDY